MANNKEREAKIRESYSKVEPNRVYGYRIYVDALIKERTLVETMGISLNIILKMQKTLGKRKINNGDIYYKTSNIGKLLSLFGAEKKRGCLERKVN